MEILIWSLIGIAFLCSIVIFVAYKDDGERKAKNRYDLTSEARRLRETTIKNK